MQEPEPVKVAKACEYERIAAQFPSLKVTKTKSK